MGLSLAFGVLEQWIELLHWPMIQMQFPDQRMMEKIYLRERQRFFI